MKFQTILKSRVVKSIAELLLPIIFMITAFIMAMGHLQQYRLAGNEPFFYQSSFEPAVMVACGHNFGIERVRTSEALAQFLKLEKQSFDCKDLPQSPDLVTNTHHQGWFYMLSAAATVWKISGEINWIELDVLPSLFFALSIASLYGLFRLAGGQILASLGILAVLNSSQYFEYLPFLRDYSKAPFILLATLLLMWLVVRARSFRAQFALSLLLGIVIGIGYGFRPDVLIVLPLVVAAIIVFIRSMRLTDFLLKVFLVMTFLAAFIFSSWPMLNAAKESGSGTFHFPLLGLNNQFTTQMGVVGSLYEWVYQFNDHFVHAIVTSHGIRNHNTERVGYCTPDYDKISADLYQSLVKTFPADMLTRATASALQVLNTYKFSLIVIFSALFLLTAAKPIIGIFSGLLVFYLAAYPAIQFHPRHFFHLHYIPIMAAIFLFHQTYNYRGELLRILRLEQHCWRKVWTAARNSGLIFVTLGIIAITLLLAARRYQARQVVELVESYKSEEVWHNIPMMENKERPEVPYFPIKILDDPVDGNTHGERLVDSAMIRLRFNSFNCLPENSVVTVSYVYSAPHFDLTRNIDLKSFVTANESLEVFMPVYRSSGYPNSGIAYHHKANRIEVPAELLHCTDGIEVSAGRPKQRLWIEFILPHDWRERPLYQRIGVQQPSPGWPFHSYPDDSSLTFQQAKVFLSNVKPAAIQPLEYQANIVSALEGDIVVDGKVDTPYSYLFQLPEEDLVDPQLFLMEGELFTGGLTVGMIKNDQWASQINIAGYGKFLVAIEHSKGIYIPTVANNMPLHSSNNFVIRRMGWVDSSMYKPEISQ